jgi:hypothetical protein
MEWLLVYLALNLETCGKPLSWMDNFEIVIQMGNHEYSELATVANALVGFCSQPTT